VFIVSFLSLFISCVLVVGILRDRDLVPVHAMHTAHRRNGGRIPVHITTYPQVPYCRFGETKHTVELDALRLPDPRFTPKTRPWATKVRGGVCVMRCPV
jgi:hypothetical protein